MIPTLVKHTLINREFFTQGSRPRKQQWHDWVQDGVVVGKIIGNDIFIDKPRFAANSVFNGAPKNSNAMNLLLKTA